MLALEVVAKIFVDTTASSGEFNGIHGCKYTTDYGKQYQEYLKPVQQNPGKYIICVQDSTTINITTTTSKRLELSKMKRLNLDMNSNIFATHMAGFHLDIE